jgi:hypothetical protein
VQEERVQQQAYGNDACQVTGLVDNGYSVDAGGFAQLLADVQEPGVLLDNAWPNSRHPQDVAHRRVLGDQVGFFAPGAFLAFLIAHVDTLP